MERADIFDYLEEIIYVDEFESEENIEVLELENNLINRNEIGEMNQAVVDYVCQKFFDNQFIEISREDDMFDTPHFGNRILFVGSAGCGKLSGIFKRMLGDRTRRNRLNVFINDEMAQEISSVKELISYWTYVLNDDYLDILEKLDPENIFVYFDNIDRLSVSQLDHWAIELNHIAGWFATARSDVQKLHHYNKVRAIPGFLGGIWWNAVANRSELIDSLEWVPKKHHAACFTKYFMKYEVLATFISIWQMGSAPSLWDVARSLWDERIHRYKVPATAVEEFLRIQNQYFDNVAGGKIGDEPLFLGGTDQFFGEFSTDIWLYAGMLFRDENGSYKYVNSLIRDFMIFKNRKNNILSQGTADFNEAAWAINYLLGLGDFDAVARFFNTYVDLVWQQDIDLEEKYKLAEVADVIPKIAIRKNNLLASIFSS